MIVIFDQAALVKAEDFVCYVSVVLGYSWPYYQRAVEGTKSWGRNFHQQPYHRKAPSNSGQELAAMHQENGWQSSVYATFSVHHI